MYIDTSPARRQGDLNPWNVGAQIVSARQALRPARLIEIDIDVRYRHEHRGAAHKNLYDILSQRDAILGNGRETLCVVVTRTRLHGTATANASRITRPHARL